MTAHLALGHHDGAGPVAGAELAILVAGHSRLRSILPIASRVRVTPNLNNEDILNRYISTIYSILFIHTVDIWISSIYLFREREFA